MMRVPPYRGVARWLADLDHQGDVMQVRTVHHLRFERTAQTLTTQRIGDCANPDALARLIQVLKDGRHDERAFGYGLFRCFTRAELGALIVAAQNRATLLGLGRTAPKARNPRFDLGRIPDERLDHLIQRHPDLDLVERCRTERKRRQMAMAA
jgi:hypothetical protein